MHPLADPWTLWGVSAPLGTCPGCGAPRDECYCPRCRTCSGTGTIACERGEHDIGSVGDALVERLIGRWNAVALVLRVSAVPRPEDAPLLCEAVAACFAAAKEMRERPVSEEFEAMAQTLSALGSLFESIRRRLHAAPLACRAALLRWFELQLYCLDILQTNWQDALHGASPGEALRFRVQLAPRFNALRQRIEQVQDALRSSPRGTAEAGYA